MENIYDFSRESYVPALIKKNSIFEKCVYLLEVVIRVIKVIALGIPYFLFSIYRLLVSPAKKVVTGQTVLVTGGGNGIGKEIALRFAREGCNIAIADVDILSAEKTAKELNEMKMNIIARAYHVDISNSDQVKKLKTDIENDIRPVDILVNNVGIIPMLSLREGTELDIERIIKVNITSQLCVTRAFLPRMIERKRGHIVGLSSLIALHPVGGAIIYSATKSAVYSFMISLNEELRQEGNDCIKCTSVHPYFVSTRKEVIDAANLAFPVVSPKDAANIAVDAVLRDELIVTIPRIHLWLLSFFQLLPISIQMLARDYVLKERGTRLLSKDNKKQ